MSSGCFRLATITSCGRPDCGCRRREYLALDFLDSQAKRGVSHAPLDQIASIDHGAMVAAAEVFADRRVGAARDFAAEEHRYLPGEGDALSLAPGLQHSRFHTEFASDVIDDVVQGADRPQPAQIRQHALGEVRE
jgi:hypothetical protein